MATCSLIFRQWSHGGVLTLFYRLGVLCLSIGQPFFRLGCNTVVERSMEWAACRDARLGMGARGGGYAAGDAWYVGAHSRAPLHRATMRGVYRRATMRGVYRRATMCYHARGVPPCNHAWGVPPCAPNNRHQPIHHPDHRCPNAFTEPMTPIRRGAPPCAPTIAGVGCWVAGCMDARPCAPTIAGVGCWVAECMGAPPCHHAWGAPPCAPTCLPPTESRRG